MYSIEGQTGPRYGGTSTTDRTLKLDGTQPSTTLKTFSNSVITTRTTNSDHSDNGPNVSWTKNTVIQTNMTSSSYDDVNRNHSNVILIDKTTSDSFGDSDERPTAHDLSLLALEPLELPEFSDDELQRSTLKVNLVRDGAVTPDTESPRTHRNRIKLLNSSDSPTIMTHGADRNNNNKKFVKH